MNIMLYAYKRDFEVQKAERWFKERGIKVQAVDMKKHAPGLKELKLFAKEAGLKNIIDKESRAYLESTLRFLNGEQAILEGLAATPALIKGPIVRNGAHATAGFQPEVWEAWQAE
ncbi:MAG: ArsC family transcriptional regulator [Clostridia bacterium]